MELKCELYHDNFQNYKRYNIPKAQLVMVFNWFEWRRDSSREYPKIHPTQKPISVLRRLIEIFTDPGDVVIDPCAGSASTLRAAFEIGRNAYGFEVDKNFYQQAKKEMLGPVHDMQRVQQMRLAGV